MTELEIDNIINESFVFDSCFFVQNISIVVRDIQNFKYFNL